MIQQTFTKAYYTRIESLKLNSKISTSKWAYFFKMIIKSNSNFDILRKNTELIGKNYFCLATNGKREIFGQIRENGKKEETMTIMIRESIEKGLIKIISESHSQLKKARLYQIQQSFYDLLFPHKNDVIDLFMPISKGGIKETFGTEKQEEKPTEQPTEKENLFLDTLSNMRLNMSTPKWNIEFSNWSSTATFNNLTTTMSQLEDFSNKDYWVTESEKSGRVYHSYCNITKKLRSNIQLRYRDKWYDMQEIDLTSCQAYLLQIILDCPEYNNLISGSANFPDIYLWLLDKLNLTSVPNKSLSKSNIQSRQEMKVDFYKFLYSGKRHSTITDYIFEQHAPEIYKKIQEVRSKFKSESVTLASTLQKLESDLFYPIFEEFKNRAIQLHDSIHFISDENTKKKIQKRLETRISDLKYPTNFKFNFN